MPYRKREFGKGGYFHVFNRGVNKEEIFFSKENYLYFLSLVRKYSELYSITIIAYCLMPNHFHLLLRQDNDVPISKFINVTLNAYVQGVNKQLDRKGPLFEGRFKHIKIENPKYLIHLCRYIHLNPVSAAIVKDPGDWANSNYLEWIGLRNGKLQDADFIASQFKDRKDYKSFCLDLIDEKELLKKLDKYLLE